MLHLMFIAYLSLMSRIMMVISVCGALSIYINI